MLTEENMVPYRIRTHTIKPLLLKNFSLFEKRRSPQLGPQSYFAKNICDFEPGDCNDELPRCQHPRIVLCDDVVHLFYELRTLECQMCSSFLKVTNAEEIIFVRLHTRMIANMFH